jgi:hypothetical protein
LSSVLGLGLIALGAISLWVAFNATRNSVAREIDSIYARFTAMPTKVYFLSGGALLIGFGLLFLLGVI